MAQPGMPGGQFPGEDANGRKIKDIERSMRELAAANQLKTAGIDAVEGGIVVQGSQTVNGPLVINGPATITGTLSLPAGIIGNDALTDPLVISTSGVSHNNYATTTAATVYATATVIIPEGYSKADVLCMVVGGAINSTANPDYLYVAASINGAPGGETPQLGSPNGGYASAAANGIRSLTGLSGGTITVGCQVRSGGVWAASASNIANMNAVIYFRR